MKLALKLTACAALSREVMKFNSVGSSKRLYARSLRKVIISTGSTNKSVIIMIIMKVNVSLRDVSVFAAVALSSEVDER